ncbi:hypothetical protein EYC84_001213 [Monilinia fructicola]|uniref:LysM domain-containing protein n=2 Tax=Monilinia fructicola TaxID=38448 RepID=A0A5M9JJG7_MONFR|nr:hypothetical protein EYC84_001213 [Monilinia fructicola]
MIASPLTMQLLAVVTLLFCHVPSLVGLFTSIATSDLSTGELVGVVIISSQTVYVQEPNFFPATVWGVPEVTPSTTGRSAAGTGITVSTSDNTHSSFSNCTLPPATPSTAALPTATFPAPVSQGNTSATPSSSSADVLPTPAATTTPIADELATVTTSSKTCNTDVAGVTIPIGDLTIGEFVAAYVTCGQTIYIQEPNFYAPKTYYGVPASAMATPTDAASPTGGAAKPRVLAARMGNIPAIHRTRPTLLRQADEDRIHSVPSGVAGNRGAAALRQKGGMRKRMSAS